MHNFKYTFITLFRNKMLIFWTFAFPIILGIFFNMAFSNIENSEKLEIIDIAIVTNDEFENESISFKMAFSSLSNENDDDRMFNIKYVSEEDAKELLENDEIVGYLKIEENNPKIVVNESGINETVFKFVTEEISQTEQIMKTIAENRIQQLPQGQEENLNSLYAKTYAEIMKLNEENKINIENISNANLSYTMIEFYTLIAMACLYGGILGVSAINNNLANMSSIGKRTSMSPTSKGKVVITTVLASYLVQLIGLALLFLFTIFVLKVDYGTNLPMIILLAIAGSFAGLTMGIAIGTVFKSSDNTKTGIIISVTMLGCFLSGMMGITMKYIIDTNAPIVNKVNPASMITDGFYSLYYYDTLNRFIFNVASLLIFSLIMMLLSFISLRRQKYDSI